MKKQIEYWIAVSPVFPSTHKKKGEPTYFVEEILNGIKAKWDIKYVDMGLNVFVEESKIHTIRANFPLWEKRFKKIDSGEAVLVIFYWEKPGGCYVKGNTRIEVCRLSREDGIGIQEIIPCVMSDWAIRSSHSTECYIGYDSGVIAKNDGLSLEDFKEWFKHYDLSEPMGILHLTSFRY